jgi:6-phosphogluconolactonase
MRRALVVTLLCACGGGSTSKPPGDGADDIDAPADATITASIAYISGGADLTWYDVDRGTGALSKISSVTAFRTGASFLAVRGDRMYAVAQNRVGAYSIGAGGALTFINDVASVGNGPTHVSIDATGKFVLVANYTAGNVGVHPVQANGGLGAAIQTVAPGANAHLITVDPTNKYVFVPCLGSDYVAQYQFDASTGELTPNAVPYLMTVAGAGPRHLHFSPDGKHAYLINETNSTLQALAYDSSTGRLTSLQTLSSRAAGAMGNNTTAEIFVHPSGKFVYGSNRGDNNIAVFARDATTGMLTPVGHTSTQGMTPRNFGLDVEGKFLYAANQNSNTVVPFAIDAATGALTPTASSVAETTPQYVGVIVKP